MTTQPGWFDRLSEALLKRGINTVLEVFLWITLFYIIVGVGYTMFHVELMDQLEHALNSTFPIFADIAALFVMVALWPLLLCSALMCGVAACGVVALQ